MKRCGIYLIEHTESGMRYVGQSRDIERRLREHGNGHRSSKGHLSAAVSKYGWQAFSVRVLEECDSAALNGVEVMWIADLDTQHPRGYNLTSGGRQSTCINAETRARMSASMKGIPKSAEWRAAMSERQRNPVNLARIAELSRHQSAEQKAKQAERMRNRVVSPETCAKISAAAKARKRSPHSVETREKMANSARAWRAARRDSAA